MSERSAGILLHISSLPSPYGIGDLGPESYAFAGFLEAAGQTYWQILPLSPTEQVSGNSPYSGLSAFAGNILLISPELLAEEGLLQKKELPQKTAPESKVDFEKVTEQKVALLNTSWKNFSKNGPEGVKKDFEKFCSREKEWLEDYSLYAALKNKYGTSWTEWPEEIKFRDPEKLRELKDKTGEEIRREMFFQFLFYRQWFRLKKYCNDRGIKIFGDIPFYVGMDSSDVWANPVIFKLDDKLNPRAVSGVPPDYFSKTGQLWGTPVFEWNKQKKKVYAWWTKRLKHCLKIYDLLRLDHFRAFSDFWEVPAGEETAINGKWITGPGADFFQKLEKEIPGLPLIAEDLGDIDDAVRDLMKQFNLPGMRILQFAFGGDTGENLYAPHRHIQHSLVYTGTHDNNTVRGWYGQSSKEERRNLSQYTGRKITAAKVHEVFIQMAMSSVAYIAIVPLQDYLGFGEDAIMNRPSVAKGNWEWRLQNGEAHPQLAKNIRHLVKLFGRERPELTKTKPKRSSGK